MSDNERTAGGAPPPPVQTDLAAGTTPPPPGAAGGQPLAAGARGQLVIPDLPLDELGAAAGPPNAAVAAVLNELAGPKQALARSTGMDVYNASQRSPVASHIANPGSFLPGQNGAVTHKLTLSHARVVALPANQRVAFEVITSGALYSDALSTYHQDLMTVQPAARDEHWELQLADFNEQLVLFSIFMQDMCEYFTLLYCAPPEEQQFAPSIRETLLARHQPAATATARSRLSVALRGVSAISATQIAARAHGQQLFNQGATQSLIR
jgi:hypothetical protein